MKLEVPQLGKVISVDSDHESLFRVLKNAHVPVASSCNGDGICGKCVLQILRGSENLTPPTELELKLHDKYQIPEFRRISCQCRMTGDVAVQASYW